MPQKPPEQTPGGPGQGAGSPQQAPAAQAGASPDAEYLANVLRQIAAAGGLSVVLTQKALSPVDTVSRLNAVPPASVPFPPCPEVLLALIRTSDVPAASKDEVTQAFDEYFAFEPHRVLHEDPTVAGGRLTDHLDPGLVRCLQHGGGPAIAAAPSVAWPSECCLCPSCVTLRGDRNRQPGVATVPSLRRLFLGDLVWLFYFERMGIFRILGAVLDDFASRGRFPISGGTLEPGLRDDIVALVLETMVRQYKTGLSSTVRDRDSSYRRCLGWTSEPGRKLELDTQVNTAASALFHKFVYHALVFYRDRRLAVAIRGTASTPTPPSVATLITIRDTLELLRRAFEPFSYGRNLVHTLSGIVWVVAGLSVVRELRTTLGIPPAFEQPHEYIPAAYDLLVLRRPVTPSDVNRYSVHRECARTGRDLLLDIEVLNFQAAGFADPGGELDAWLTQAEGRVEGYRTAYRTLTGVDLGAPGTPAIEQQV